MHPYFNGIDSFLTLHNNSTLTIHHYVHYIVLQLFDHAIVSIWVLDLWCLDFLNSLIPLVSMEGWMKDHFQDRRRQAFLDLIDLSNQILIFHGQYCLKQHIPYKHTFSAVV